jgi:hypothetical protein
MQGQDEYKQPIGFALLRARTLQDKGTNLTMQDLLNPPPCELTHAFMVAEWFLLFLCQHRLLTSMCWMKTLYDVSFMQWCTSTEGTQAFHLPSLWRRRCSESFCIPQIFPLASSALRQCMDCNFTIKFLLYIATCRTRRMLWLLSRERVMRVPCILQCGTTSLYYSAVVNLASYR